jgi:hypothetical protein
VVIDVVAVDQDVDSIVVAAYIAEPIPHSAKYPSITKMRVDFMLQNR